LEPAQGIGDRRALTADCRAYGRGGDAVLIGPEGFKTFHRSFCGAFPDLRVTVDDVFAEGDKVAIRWGATMTHLGDGLGFPPSGKKVSMDGSTILAVKDGNIDEGWNHMDITGLFAKLKTA
jgi:predicted ester cyclase